MCIDVGGKGVTGYGIQSGESACSELLRSFFG